MLPPPAALKEYLDYHDLEDNADAFGDIGYDGDADSRPRQRVRPGFDRLKEAMFK